MGAEPAYTRMAVDQRRAELIDAGARLFVQHAYDEITMRDVARAAGVSKPLLYHYFPSKTELFKAAVAEKAAELGQVIAPKGHGAPLDQLTESLDAYLEWIEHNAQTWSKLMQSATTLPEARELVESFREHTMNLVLAGLTGRGKARPVLRTAIKGWLGYMDAAILDWTQAKDIPRHKLRQLLLTAFSSTLLAAQHADPRIKLQPTA